MALNWTDKVDGVDDILAEDINEVAHAVMENEEAIKNKADKKQEMQLVLSHTLTADSKTYNPTNIFNLIEGKIIITFPEIVTAISGRPQIFFAHYTGEPRSTSKVVSQFADASASKVDATPIYIMRFNKLTDDIIEANSNVINLGSQSTSVNPIEMSDGIRLTKLDGEDRFAVNTIYFYHSVGFPTGTQFEVWGY